MIYGIAMYHKDFINEKRVFYKTISRCYCPALKKEIIFNAQGFRHLRYDGLGHARNIAEQISRMKLLDLLVPAIKNAQTIFEYRAPTKEDRSGGTVEYWALHEIVGGQAISVILKKCGDGNVVFHSVWKIKSKKPSR